MWYSVIQTQFYILSRDQEGTVWEIKEKEINIREAIFFFFLNELVINILNLHM